MFISGHSLTEWLLFVIQTGGWVGVDLFFVLSGFLVSGLIFKEFETTGTFAPGRFLLRRGFKIYPTFYFFLLVTWFIHNHFNLESRESNLKFLYEAIFICNYTKLEPMHSWLWSICVEEHFYILLSIIMLLLIKFRFISVRSFLLLYFGFLILGFTIRVYYMYYHGFDFYRDFTRSHIRFDALFFGVLLNYLYRKKALQNWKSPFWTIIALAGVSLPFIFSFDDPRYTRFDTAFFLALNPVCFGYLMIRMLKANGKWMAPFAYIGKYSYSIYLFHGFINALCHRWLTGWKYSIAYLLASLVIGIVVSKVVEYPFLALRDKWFPASASPSIAAAATTIV